VNTITIELVEATKQIGFLRILGIKASDVGRLFIMQSIILAVTGVIIGIVGGIIVGALTNGAIKAVADQGPVGATNTIYAYQIPVWQIIIMVMLAVLLGWAIGLLPAKRAVAINPLEALKS
jgi:ABC-type lipoprotein release transport system permease subunit